MDGNLTGLKPSQIKRLNNLFKRRTPPKTVISHELSTTLSELSKEIGRQLGLLLDRRGQVDRVIVGSFGGLLLPDIGRHRAGVQRFRGLRLVHTHLGPQELSREDLTDLSRLRLDMIAAMEVDAEGRPGRVHMAHLVPPNPKGDLWRLMEPMAAHRLPSLDFDALIRAVEAEFTRKVGVRDADDLEGAILVHVQVPGGPNPEDSLRELAELADTANVRVLDTQLQRRPRMDPRYMVGKGKLEELVLQSLQFDADVIVFDHDLSPAQVRAIGNFTDLKVIDRTQLILDIFAQRAQSNEGKLQVELAQLKYMLPRLAGKYTAMARQAGGVGARRGPGEKQIEVDRRRMRDRIHRLEKEINKLSKQRENRRSLRRRRDIPLVSIVGYTNAGKSTLLNTLTSSDVLAENKLFATLDPTTRRLRFPKDREVILADTVGFIRDLPKDLMNAFRATLEELHDSDVLIHLVDITGDDLNDRIQSVHTILEHLGLQDKPMLLVLNKADMVSDCLVADRCHEWDAMAISARNPTSTMGLLNRVEDHLWRDSKDVNRPRPRPSVTPMPGPCPEPALTGLGHL